MTVEPLNLNVQKLKTPPSAVLVLQSFEPARTQAIGESIGAQARPGDVVLLIGDLGAGKTCLTQGILWGLGSKDHVRSPTFVLIMEHAARIPLYHADLYRLEQGSDLNGVGLEEYLQGDGLCVVEWADRAPGVFPNDRLEVSIEQDENQRDGRTLTLTAFGVRYVDLLQSLIAGIDRLSNAVDKARDI